MIRIAICDNDMAFCHILETILERILKGQKYEIEDFSDGRELLQEIEHEPGGAIFQIIILEVNIPVLDGIQLGHRIRGYSAYHATRLVYVSHYDCGAGVITALHPWAYLDKNMSRKELRKQLENCIMDLQPLVRYLSKQNDGYMVLNTEKIQYMESVNRRTLVHMEDGSIVEILTPLQDILQELRMQDAYLVQTHKSFAVNARLITGFCKNEVELYKGLQVPVSHSCRVKLKNAYLELFDTNI